MPVLAERLPAIADLPPIGAAPPDPAEMAAWESFNAAVDGYVAPDVEIVDTVAPGPHGDVPVRVYRATDETPQRGFVWAHGGAFMFGDLEMPEADVVAREVATRAGPSSSRSTTGCATVASTSRCLTTTSMRRSSGRPATPSCCRAVRRGPSAAQAPAATWPPAWPSDCATKTPEVA